MKRSELRERNGKWCAIEVALETPAPGKTRLAICGSAGVVVTRARARKEALVYWESYFADEPAELIALGKRGNGTYHTEKSAARYVVASDGEYHGLDVYRETGNKVYLLHSCGQIVDELREWFPECVPYLPWHLNDMRVSPERIITPEHEGTNAHGQTVTVPAVIAPKGASWDYEPLPQSVIDWANKVGT